MTRTPIHPNLYSLAPHYARVGTHLGRGARTYLVLNGEKRRRMLFTASECDEIEARYREVTLAISRTRHPVRLRVEKPARVLSERVERRIAEYTAQLEREGWAREDAERRARAAFAAEDAPRVEVRVSRAWLCGVRDEMATRRVG
jgi:hypothetical protein